MTRVIAFLGGLVIAAIMVGVWSLVGRNTEVTLQVGSGPGLIGQTYENIRERVARERKVVRPVRGDLRFRARNIVWQDPGRPDFLRAEEMTGQLSTRAAGHADIVVHGVEINNGDVYVEQDGGGQWSYRRVMAPFFVDNPGPSRVFIATDVAIRNTRVRVKRPNQSYAFVDVAAQLPRAEFAGPNLAAPRVTVARATGTLIVKDSSYRVAADNAQLVFPTGRVDFNVGTVVIGQTRLTAFAGTWGGDLPGLALAATGQVEHLRFEDVRFASPRLPPTGTAQFGFRIRPVSNDLTEVTLTNARMESQGSQISGSATVQVGESQFALEAVDARFDPVAVSLLEQMMGDTLPFKGTVVGTARGTNGLVTFDVATRLSTREVPEPFVTRFTGTARIAARGFEIRSFEATLRSAPLLALRAIFPGLPLKGTVTGKISLNGPTSRAPLTLNVRGELANGVIDVEGTIDLTGAVPSYNLHGRLLAVNMQALFKPDVPPVFLNARFSLVGSGRDANTMNAGVQLIGNFTGWQSNPHDTLHVAARVQAGTLNIDSSFMKLASMDATARGQWHFAAPATGSIDYHLAFTPITPFGPYIPAIGDEDASGNVSVTGTASGARGAMQFVGAVSGSSLVVGHWGASALEGKYQLGLVSPVPQVNVDFTARDLRTPTAGGYQTAHAVVRLQAPVFALEIKAERATDKAGGIEIVADGRIPPTGQREVVLHSARIDLASDNWSLTTPAVVSWTAPMSNVTVRAFEMRKASGRGLFRLEGRVVPLANADFKLTTEALPIGDIQRLLGREPDVSGALSTTTSIRAVAGVPQLAIVFQLDSAVIEGVGFSQLKGDATFLQQKLTTDVTATVDTAGALRLHADLPMDLQFGASVSAKLLESGPVHITLLSDSIALAPFAALDPADIEKLNGKLSANVTVTGTVEEPMLAGTLSVRDGAAHVIPLNQNFDSISGTITLENRRATIQQLTAHAGGKVRASGTVEFRDLTKPMLDITASLEGFQPIGVDNQPDAAMNGEVHIGGPLRAAVMTGHLQMHDGYFPVPQVGAAATMAELAQFEPDANETGEAPPPTPFYETLTIDSLDVTVGPNLWFTMEDAKAELAGNLTIEKHGADLDMVGDLTGERGTYVLRAGPIIRRFDVVQANVRFLGGSVINPVLDIKAQRTVIDVSGRQLNIQVHVGGTMRSPTLALASTEAVNIPQSELLSFLLFGQPSFALQRGPLSVPGGQVIEQAVAGTFSELASIELEQGLLDQLGMSFDVFQIRLGGAQLSQLSPSLVVGEEVAHNVFLTVESGVRTLFGGTESPTATFALHLEWHVNDDTTVRASFEPVNERTGLRGFVALPATIRPSLAYQKTVEIRRRWTW